MPICALSQWDIKGVPIFQCGKYGPRVCVRTWFNGFMDSTNEQRVSLNTAYPPKALPISVKSRIVGYTGTVYMSHLHSSACT